jgi:hypothetical protein
MFGLSEPGRLQQLLEEGGFVEVEVEAVQLDRTYETLDEFLDETHDLSMMFAEAYDALDEDGRREVVDTIASNAASHMSKDGSLLLPGSSLVAVAAA